MIDLETRILQLRHKQACISMQLALKRIALAYGFKYAPDQPRDDHGRWTSGGGVGAADVSGQAPVAAPPPKLQAKPIQLALNDTGSMSDAGILPVRPAGAIGTAPDGTAVTVAAQDGTSGRYFVDLTQEEDFGGHTLEKHVGKSDDYLLYRMNTEVYDYGIFETPLNFASTFPSLGAANKLVNSTLSQNSTFVDDVAAGNYGNNPVEVISHFDSPTGRQAFRTSDNSQPRLRDVFGVLVVIKYDPSVPKGFYIKTAYPTNY